MVGSRRNRGRAGEKHGRNRRRAGKSGTLDAERVRAALRGARQPLSTRRLADQLGVDGRALNVLLLRLEASGGIERSRGRWRLARADGLVEAVVERDGGALLDGAGRRWALESTEGARPGDRVLAQGVEGHAEILQVVDGLRERWVGIVGRRRRDHWLTPYRDDARWALRIGPRDLLGARQGEVVVAVPAGGGSRRRRGRQLPKVRVVERLGHPGDSRADLAAVVWRHRLPVEFPRPVLAEVASLSAGLDPRDLASRRDLRDGGFVTIDPVDARDHDDAVRVQRRSAGGWRLQVAIADVAQWVPLASAMDREAYRRGNSVYFPEQSIPMLPERLSSDLCSLRPGEDRLAVVVELDFDARAGLVGRRVDEAVICSRARLAYEEADPVVAGHDGRHPQAETLVSLGALARALYRRRRSRSVNFDIPEPVFSWGKDGRPVDVQPALRTSAHRGVEEAMLAANRAVASLLVEAGVATVHRVHEAPTPEDEKLLRERLDALGLLGDGGDGKLDSSGLSAALRRARGHPAEAALRSTMLRAMRQARYAPEGLGHFALGFADYLHFTSPIRRYADLSVHRALKELLAGAPGTGSTRECARVAARSSFRERLSVSAERERADLARCALLSRHLGAKEEGTISGIARHGFYVRLDSWLTEGLVHVSRLPGFLVPDALGLALVEEGSGARYALGDRVLVRIEAADPVRNRIDFALEARLAPGGASPD